MKLVWVAIMVIAIFLSSMIGAEISTFTFTAKVKSFTEDMVVVEHRGQVYEVKRDDVKQKKFLAGDTVEIVMYGQDIELKK